MNSQEYNLNIRPGVGIPPIVRVSQDDAGRPLAFKMYDGASALTIASGTTIEIHGTKRSGLGFTETCTWSGSTVSVDTTEAMTQESGAIPTELVFTSGTDVIASANFMLVIEPSPHSAAVTDGTVAEAISAVTRCETYAQAAEDAADNAASDAAEAAETAVNALIATIPADYTSLTTQVATNTADIGDLKADLGDKDNLATADKTSLVSAINEIVSGGVSSGLTENMKSALLACFQNVAWANEDGDTYYQALYDALYEVLFLSLDSNSIIINSLGGTTQLTATTVPTGASVTWSSSDTSVATVTSSGLVTAIAYGSATITATSGELTATCSVTVSQATLTSISAVYTQSGTVYETDSLDDLISDLVVTATWSDSSTSTVASSSYTLSGTLAEGTSTITVTYGTQTDTFNVTVTANSVESISAAYTQSGRVYEDTALSSLKSDLVVTATYANSTTDTVASSDYTLSGTLAVGTSTVTVAYEGCTTTFTVTVSDENSVPDGYTNIEYVQANNTSSSTLQIAETDYVPNANTALDYKIAYLENRTVGHIISAASYYAPLIRSSGNKYFANRCGNETEVSLASTYVVGTPITIQAYMDGTDNIVVDGTTIATLAAGSATPSNNFKVFAYSFAYTNAVAGRIYYIKIYESGTLVRHYVAAKRDSDNVVGLYDLVNDTFITPPSSSNYTPFTGPTE